MDGRSRISNSFGRSPFRPALRLRPLGDVSTILTLTGDLFSLGLDIVKSLLFRWRRSGATFRRIGTRATIITLLRRFIRLAWSGRVICSRHNITPFSFRDSYLEYVGLLPFFWWGRSWQTAWLLGAGPRLPAAGCRLCWALRCSSGRRWWLVAHFVVFQVVVQYSFSRQRPPTDT